MKALLGSALAIFALLSVAYGASLGDWTSLRGGSSMASFSGGVQLHPPFEADWEEASKPPRGFLCAKDRLAVICSDEITLYAISTREMIKRIQVSPSCDPCIFDNLLVVTTSDKLTAFNLDQGRTAFEAPLPNVNHLLEMPSGVIAFTKTQALLVDPKGTPKEVIRLDFEVSGNPVIAGGVLVCPLQDGSLQSYSLQTFEMASKLENIGPFTSCAAISEDAVLVSLAKGGCSLVDLSQQKVLWTDKEPRGGDVKIMFDGLHPIVYGKESGITCKRLDGTTLWKNNRYEPLSMFSTPRLLFVTTADGKLRSFQTATGDEQVAFQLNSKAIAGFMAFKDDRLYVPMATKFARVETSPYQAVLGFVGATDFGRIYPNSRNLRSFSIVNLSTQTQAVILRTKTLGLYIKQRFLDIPPKSSVTIPCIYTTTDVLSLDEKGSIQVDTSLYRYNLGVSLKVAQLEGDCNLDCKVDMTDFALVGKLFGATASSPDYRKEVDLNRNGIIDLVDAGIVLTNMGRDCTR